MTAIFQTITAPMRLSRTALAVLISTVLLLSTWLLTWSARLRPCEEDLVAAATALSRDPGHRPTHVSAALRGAFGDALAAHLPALLPGVATYRHTSKETWAVLRAIREGQRPVRDLPLDWQQELRKNTDSIHGILHSTHAEFGRLPAPLHPLASFNDPSQDETYQALRYTAWLSVFHIHDLLSRHQGEEALDECLDGLALGRDLGSGNLLAWMNGITIQALFFPACGVAFDAAPLVVKERALRQLGSVRDAMPRASDVMRRERIVLELLTFGHLLAPGRRARLPRDAQALAVMWGGIWDNFYLRLFWPRFAEAHERMSGVWTLAVPERDLRHAEVVAGLEGRLPKAMGTWPDFRRYDDRHRASIARLEVLRAAAWVDLFRSRHDRWPRTLAEALPPGLKLDDPRTGSPISLGPRGDSVQATCPTPCGHASETFQLTLNQDGRGRL